jgi:hypothetical protein
MSAKSLPRSVLSIVAALDANLPAQTLIPVFESGPRSERINLVVISEAYTAAELEAKFPSDGAAFIEAFLSRQPFAATGAGSTLT